LKISSSGWSISPSQLSVEFTAPLRCNRITQAAVRTRSEVQNGSSTRIRMRLRQPPDTLAISIATG
jgi:hypothetical protein